MAISLLREKIREKQARLQAIEAEKLLLLKELQQLQQEENHTQSTVSETTPFSTDKKIEIFMSLFRGRADVVAKRWDNAKTGKSGYSPACSNEWIRGICKKPQIKCSVCTKQAFIPMTPEIVYKHLGGESHFGNRRDYILGLYPMLQDDYCWFLAVDFDKENWQKDANAFIKTCHNQNISVALERSRSGNGAHAWIFFEQAIPAFLARQMGTALLTETMKNYPEIGLESYDRLFPNQDTLPAGGFGNLIALPLQYLPRKKGNSVFLDEQFEPYADQWAFLASIKKITYAEINAFVAEARRHNNILDIKMAVLEEEETKKPWELPPSKILPEKSIPKALLPKTITLVLNNQLFIDKKELPPALINKLIKLAAFQNPAFYKAQAMRLPVFDKPRIIACAEYFTDHLGLPRGCLEECLALLNSLSIEVVLEDKRYLGKSIKTKFTGELTTEQKKATKALLTHDNGVLSATTAFGKTVVGAYMIAKRKRSTLIIVHRRQLMEQWVERLKVFLDLTSDQIGTIGGGKRKLSGIIDVAVIQSLIKKNTVDNLVAEYGHIIIDECHHLSAVSFEAVARSCKAKYVLGLTATATRKDGHQPIIFMQCGPIRYNVDAKKQAQLRAFSHKVIVRNTSFNFVPITEEKITIGQLYSAMILDKDRNEKIFQDVLSVLKTGRSPLLLTERKEHVLYFAEKFKEFCKNIIVMVGGQSDKQRAAVNQQLSSIPDSEERLLIATGRYIGEGFDDPRLDTLFLSMPISWHGTLAQYAGRLHRAHQEKREVIIYDYVDYSSTMLAKMAEKRMKGYINLGYEISRD